MEIGPHFQFEGPKFKDYSLGAKDDNVGCVGPEFPEVSPIEHADDGEDRRENVEAMIANLAHRVPVEGRITLPVTVDELLIDGMCDHHLSILRFLVQLGYKEVDVVRAFLEFLGFHLTAEGHHGRLCLELRQQFADMDECRDLRGLVYQMITGLPVPAVIG